jgi:hypothetical protein
MRLFLYGTLLDADTLSLRVLARLAAYEGSAYRLTRVVVQTPNGNTVAHTWIAPGGTRRKWRT